MNIVFTKQVEPYKLSEEILVSFPTADISYTGILDTPIVEKHIIVDNTSATEQQILDIITAHDYVAAVAARMERTKDITVHLNKIQIACWQVLLQELRTKFAGTFTMTNEQFRQAVKDKLTP